MDFDGGQSIFPNPATEADEEGFLGFSKQVTVPMLQDAYWHGIFPWPFDNTLVPWCSPSMRGVIPLEEFHIPRSFQRQLRKKMFELRIDTAFEEVIRACAGQERPDGGTWIVPKMIRAYCAFHRLGWAHSFETWERSTGKLVGGLYGVSIGGVFAGESMFHSETGASKFALVGAATTLRRCGVKLLDTQMVTSTTALFGAREIPRDAYLALLQSLRGAPLTSEELRQGLSCG